MYLSRLIVAPRDRTARRDLADCQHLHRTVMSAFPQVPQAQDARAHLGVLYRIDPSVREGRIALLVQSRAKPDWSNLPQGYLLHQPDLHDNPEVKSVVGAWQALTNGMPLRFRLRANPTRRVHRNNSREHDAPHWAGKRVELYREVDQVAWLHRQGERWGFQVLATQVRQDVPNLAVMPSPKMHGRRGGGVDPTRPLTFGAATFDGLLRIAELPTFRQALETGIGPGKAYGFGLLSIAPAGGRQ